MIGREIGFLLWKIDGNEHKMGKERREEQLRVWNV
jgi:hypothetical protein